MTHDQETELTEMPETENTSAEAEKARLIEELKAEGYEEVPDSELGEDTEDDEDEYGYEDEDEDTGQSGYTPFTYEVDPYNRDMHGMTYNYGKCLANKILPLLINDMEELYPDVSSQEHDAAIDVIASTIRGRNVNKYVDEKNGKFLISFEVYRNNSGSLYVRFYR